jgi:hypothetical protein
MQCLGKRDVATSPAAAPRIWTFDNVSNKVKLTTLPSLHY